MMKMLLFCVIISCVFFIVSAVDMREYFKTVYATNELIDKAIAKKSCNQKLNTFQYTIRQMVLSDSDKFQFEKLKHMLAVPERVERAEQQNLGRYKQFQTDFQSELTAVSGFPAANSDSITEEPPIIPQPEEPPFIPQPEEPPFIPQPEEPPFIPQPTPQRRRRGNRRQTPISNRRQTPITDPEADHRAALEAERAARREYSYPTLQEIQGLGVDLRKKTRDALWNLLYDDVFQNRQHQDRTWTFRRICNIAGIARSCISPVFTRAVRIDSDRSPNRDTGEVCVVIDIDGTENMYIVRNSSQNKELRQLIAGSYHVLMPPEVGSLYNQLVNSTY